MKRILAILLIVTMIGCMFSMTALARDPIISPEKDNTTVDPNPDSPQTGGLPVGIFVAAAGLLFAVAVVSVKKAIA
jgi:hypothetical protein